MTGDVVASQISFDGTGNVSLAATIQPNSVALGGDTTGDYVESVSGTANEIDSNWWNWRRFSTNDWFCC